MTSKGVDAELKAENICEASALINVKQSKKQIKQQHLRERNKKQSSSDKYMFLFAARTCEYTYVCAVHWVSGQQGAFAKAQSFGRGALLADNLTHPTRHHPQPRSHPLPRNRSVGGATFDVANFATCSGRSSVWCAACVSLESELDSESCLS